MQTYVHPVTIHTKVDANADMSATSEHVFTLYYLMIGYCRKKETIISQLKMYI